MELLVILGIAVLLFGKRLPEVGRSLGKGIMEFKKGVRGVEEELERAAHEPKRSTYYPEDRDEAVAPKFDPPPADEPAKEATPA